MKKSISQATQVAVRRNLTLNAYAVTSTNHLIQEEYYFAKNYIVKLSCQGE
jgi:hypothetical protein